MKKTAKIGLTLFLVFTFFCCSSQKSEWQGTIEDVDGVTVVKNPKEPMYGEDVLSLEEELSIGESIGRKEYMFSEIRDLAVDDKGRIYILDGREIHIIVFDSDGRYMRTISHRGQGPGELEFPMGIQMFSQNEFIVYEGQSFSLFSVNGEFVREIHLTKTYRPQWYEIDSEGNIIGNFALQMKMLLMKYDTNQELLFIVTEVEPFGKARDRLFSPVLPLFKVTKENNILWGKSINYQLNIANPDGILLRKIVTDYDPVEITEEDKRIMSKSIISKSKVDFPKYFQPLVGFTLDDEGRIFVKREDGADSFFFDVFDPEGKYIAKIRLSRIDKWNSPLWTNNKLYLVVVDDEGFQYVKRYKVTWNY